MAKFAQISDQLARVAIEVPSWGFANSGTRFKVFGAAGVPRTVMEKIADAAQVHRYTGLAPAIAIHIPWDTVADFTKIRNYAEDNNLSIGTVNSNTFQDDDYRFGGLCHLDENVRRKAIRHHFDCIDIMDVTGSRDLKIWLADGSNYPGQADITRRQELLAESLAAIYARLGPTQRMVLEYKLFEPAFYHTDIPDWGTAYIHAVALGERAVVCVDLGHHAQGVNVEFIVAQLLRLGRLGSFDLNSRFYADDDLIAGAADPFQLFRILTEFVQGGGLDAGSSTALMLDQSHNIEPKIPGQIRSVLNVQELIARALLIDRYALDLARLEGNVLRANEIYMDAFYTDVRADLATWRERRGLPRNPLNAYAQSGYQQRIEQERTGGVQSGWN